MYYLHYFGKLICSEFRDKKASLEQACTNYEELISQLPFELTAMQQGMQQDASLLPQQDVPRFVSEHQMGIIEYANQYWNILGDQFNDMNTITAEPTRLNLAKHQYRALEEMLSFIQNYFHRHFDMDHFIPLAHLEMALREITPKITLLQEQMRELEVREDLMEIAFTPLIDFVISRERITYRRLLYLKDLLHEMELSVDGKKKTAPEDRLFNSLCFLNFNSVSFKNYIKKRCTELIGTRTTRETRLIALIRLQVKCEAFEVRGNTALWPEAEYLRENIRRWMERQQVSINDIAELERLPPVQVGKRNITGHTTTGRSIAGVPPATDYLSIAVKGSEWIFIIRLFVDHVVIAEKIKERIFQFCSERFTFDNKKMTRDTISVRYNSPSEPTRQSVKSLLKQIWRSI